MTRIIRNKLAIVQPNSLEEAEYKKQVDEVYHFCRGLDEKGIMKEMLFQKIMPIPDGFDPESKEKDDWLLMHWGTREKAYNACWISDNEMIFDTFWTPAIPIVYILMKKFPKVDFSYKYSSNKTGVGSGEVYSMNKQAFFVKARDFSKTAYEIAFELRPHLKALYTYNEEFHTYNYNTSDIWASIEQNGFYREADGTTLIGLDDKMKPLFDDTNDIDDLPF